MCFRDGQLDEAVEQYAASAASVGAALDVPALRQRAELRDLLRAAHAAHASCHLNLAAVAMKARAAAAGRGRGVLIAGCVLRVFSSSSHQIVARSGEFGTAEDHCAEALRVEPRNPKAHFRMSQARKGRRRQRFARSHPVLPHLTATRARQALSAQGRDEAACGAAAKAASLAPRDAAAASLHRAAAAAVAARKKRESARLRGMFDTKGYAKAAAAGEAERCERDAIDRARVAACLRRHASSVPPHGLSEQQEAAVGAWVARGAAALEESGEAGAAAAAAASASAVSANTADTAPPEPSAPSLLVMHALVRAAAGGGSLEDADARAAVRAHGLAAALLSPADPAAVGLTPEEMACRDEVAVTARARAIVAKSAAGEALSDDEIAALRAFRAAEAARLGAMRVRSAEEVALLEGLARRAGAEAAAAPGDAARSAAVASALAKAVSGAHVGPRERYATDALLAEEEARLGAAEAAGEALRPEETAALKKLRALSAAKQARRDARAAQAAAVEKLRAVAV